MQNMAPDLSLVVIAFSMAREAERTLRTLSRDYQRDIDAIEYDILFVDNGSPNPLLLQGEARVHRIWPAMPSPAHAANVGVAMTSGTFVGLVLDGARMVTPGVVSLAMLAMRLHPRAIVTTMAWHLGSEHQSLSIPKGYDAAAEDALLTGITWPTDGYRLFEVSALAAANPDGFLGPINESCCLFLPRALWDEVEGLDERFDLPGGGLVSLDLFSRLLDLPDTQLVVLLGEGSFHQVHGGASTTPGTDHAAWLAQYEQLRGRPYARPTSQPMYVGWLRGSARRWIAPSPTATESADTSRRGWGRLQLKKAGTAWRREP